MAASCTPTPLRLTLRALHSSICKRDTDAALSMLDDATGTTPEASLLKSDIIHFADAAHDTFLHLAAERGLSRVVARLLALGCDPLSDRNLQLKTPLMAAAASGDVCTLRVILEGIPSAEQHLLLAQHKKNAWSALMYACKSGATECVQYLLSMGADLRETNKEGATALYIAARECNNAAIISSLLVAGAEANHATASGRTALLAAVAAGNEKVVVALLAAPGLLVQHRDTSGQSVCHECAQHGLVSIFRVVWSVLSPAQQLEQVTMRDAVGRTALHYAASATACTSAQAMCMELISCGWQVDAADERGATPLYYAVVTGCVPTVRRLLECGADPCVRTHQRTILHAAVMRDWDQCLLLLLQAVIRRTLRVAPGTIADGSTSFSLRAAFPECGSIGTISAVQKLLEIQTRLAAQQDEDTRASCCLSSECHTVAHGEVSNECAAAALTTLSSGLLEKDADGKTVGEATRSYKAFRCEGVLRTVLSVVQQT